MSTKTFCEERHFLEGQIAEGLGSLSRNSLEASKLAKGPSSDWVLFERLRAEAASINLRLRVLRECIEFHRRWHGC